MDDAEPDAADDDPPPNPAAAAVNWRVVLLADLALGVAALGAGLALLALWGQVVVGAGVAALGLGYLLVVRRRATLWIAWRRRQGLAT